MRPVISQNMSGVIVCDRGVWGRCTVSYGRSSAAARTAGDAKAILELWSTSCELVELEEDVLE
jgi:hypothetical protein